MAFNHTTASIPGPDDITRLELDNGLVILARRNPNSPSVTMRGFLHVGGLFDQDEKLGLSDFVAASLMRGTHQRDFQRLHDDLESVGAGMGFSGATHTTGFSARSLAEDAELLLAILAECLRSPSFPPDQIERLRAQILTGLSLRAQNTGEMAALTFDQLVYPNHPYSRPEEGHPETIQAIKNSDLKAFHQRHYGPRSMVIAVVGSLEPPRAVDMVRRVFEDWENPEQPSLPDLPNWEPLAETVSQRLDIPGKSQSDLVVGTAGPARREPDFIPASVGNNILGQFGLMGRIGEVVREQAGLAYYAYSSISGGLGPGPWSVRAGVNPDNEEKAVELIHRELERFSDELVHPDELSDTQSNFIGRLPLSLESNAGVAGALLNLERYQLGLDYYRRYPGMIKAVTREDVLQAARQYLRPDRMAVAVAGPARTQAVP
ncbi:MAG: insulinase family protein [Anaerolineae bacterium]|nr:insulinase family protein [Anaerolineae bacterium]